MNPSLLTTPLLTPDVPEIDAEFKALIPPLSAEEHAALEESLIAEGVRDALVVWDQGDRCILVEGHNRLEICLRLHLPFPLLKKSFADREAVTIWMIQNQLGRRNMNAMVRGELVLHMKAIIAAQAKARHVTSTGGSSPQPLPISEKPAPIHTDKELGKLANVSADTIHKIESISQSAPAPIKAAARSGEISVNRAFELTKRFDALPKDDRERAAAVCGDNLDKADTLIRLYKSMGKLGSNGTYTEILTSGGFQYGKEMEYWCDFKKRSARDIDTGLRDVATLHRLISVPPPQPNEVLTVLFPRDFARSQKALEKTFGDQLPSFLGFLNRPYELGVDVT